MNTNGTTDASRRLALQLAIQLPENHTDAHHVLALTAELLDGFMVEQSPSRRRALKLGWGSVAVAAPEAGGDTLRAALCGLGSLLLALPIAAVMLSTTGTGVGLCLTINVMMVALIFGTAPALVAGLASALLHNLVLIPPALEFNRPSMLELVLWAGYLVLALGIPILARRRQQIRLVTIGTTGDNVVALRPSKTA